MYNCALPLRSPRTRSLTSTPARKRAERAAAIEHRATSVAARGRMDCKHVRSYAWLPLDRISGLGPWATDDGQRVFGIGMPPAVWHLEKTKLDGSKKQQGSASQRGPSKPRACLITFRGRLGAQTHDRESQIQYVPNIQLPVQVPSSKVQCQGQSANNKCCLL